MNTYNCIVKISPNFSDQKKYLLDVFFNDFLNIEYSVKEEESISSYLIEVDGKTVNLPDIFFSKYSGNVKAEPKVKILKTWLDIPYLDSLPAWFYSNNSDTESSLNGIQADIFGMAFFLLTGTADLTFSEKDKFERDIGKTSFLGKNNLIDRPIIQEWFTVLTFKLFGDTAKEILPVYSKHISHDVDQPYEYLDYTWRRLCKRVAGDLLIRKSGKTALQRIKLFFKVRTGDYESDPFNNFQQLLEVLKQNRITSTFFFVTDKKHPKYDVLYDIDHAAIQKLIAKVYSNNHKIGIHPSYLTLHNASALKNEVEKLNRVCAELGINETINCSRKHYLRWDWKTTPKNLHLAGIKDDYTLGYADRSGFRAGVAFPFQAYDWESCSGLGITLHPLIVMECSLLDAAYMNLAPQKAQEYMMNYQKKLKKIGGEYVLLWHNHRLLDEVELNLFKKIISQ